jgi:hypothetical protein
VGNVDRPVNKVSDQENEMAFVLKSFTDADKPSYDSLHLRNPVNTFRYPRHWAVDDDRNAKMVLFGGQGWSSRRDDAPPYFFALVWNDDVIELEGWYENTYVNGKKEEIRCEMTRVAAPKCLEGKTEILKDMVREALLALESGRAHPARSVQVEFKKLFYF